MLQIMLVVIGLMLSAGTGYAVISNIQAQNIATYQADTVRRLDLAAKAIEKSLIQVPGTTTMVAPMAATGVVSYHTIPVSVSPIRSTSNGVQFSYCPLSRMSAAEATALTGKVSQTIKSGNSQGSYSVSTWGNYVVSSSLSVNSELLAKRRPIAMLIAPIGRDTGVPTCNTVGWRDNGPYVPGGIVRVVSLPEGVGSAGGVGSRTAVFFVSPSAKGSGRSSSDPTSLADAMAAIVKEAPEAATIYVDGDNSITSAQLSSFTNASSTAAMNLNIIGTGSNPKFSISTPSSWTVPARTTLKNIYLKTGGIRVAGGRELTLDGWSVLADASVLGSAVQVDAGGVVRAVSAFVSLDTAGATAFLIRGRGIFDRSKVGGLSSPSVYFALDGGSGEFDAAWIGKDSSNIVTRPTTASITSQNGAKITGQNASVFGAVGYGCWMSLNGDLAFAFTSPGGSPSSPPDESAYDYPATGSTTAQINAYHLARDQRFQARRQNASANQCY